MHNYPKLGEMISLLNNNKRLENFHIKMIMKWQHFIIQKYKHIKKEERKQTRDAIKFEISSLCLDYVNQW